MNPRAWRLFASILFGAACVGLAAIEADKGIWSGAILFGLIALCIAIAASVRA